MPATIYFNVVDQPHETVSYMVVEDEIIAYSVAQMVCVSLSSAIKKSILAELEIKGSNNPRRPIAETKYDAIHKRVYIPKTHLI